MSQKNKQISDKTTDHMQISFKNCMNKYKPVKNRGSFIMVSGKTKEFRNSFVSENII